MMFTTIGTVDFVGVIAWLRRHVDRDAGLWIGQCGAKQLLIAIVCNVSTDGDEIRMATYLNPSQLDSDW
jgi:hypothetical protein